jgi:uncharacterized protein (DUF433 family)
MRYAAGTEGCSAGAEPRDGALAVETTCGGDNNSAVMNFLPPCYILFMASEIDRITIDPDICNGKPVVRGLRITVETILDYLSAGETAECLAFASRLMSHKYSVRETV